MFIVRFIIIISELIICYVLQTSAWTGLTLNNAVPDLLMIVVVSVAYIKGSNAGIIYGFTAGMILDLTFGSLLGYFALIYALCGFLSGQLHRIYRNDDYLTPIISSAICVLLSQSFYFFTEYKLKGRLDYSFYFPHVILPKIIYTILVSAIIYKLIQLSILWSIRLEERKAKNYD